LLTAPAASKVLFAGLQRLVIWYSKDGSKTERESDHGFDRRFAMVDVISVLNC
jgi:hypothetical protein